MSVDLLLPSELLDLVRGTPFPEPPEGTSAEDEIDYEAAAERWLERTAGWRAQLKAMGFSVPQEQVVQICADEYRERRAARLA